MKREAQERKGPLYHEWLLTLFVIAVLMNRIRTSRANISWTEMLAKARCRVCSWCPGVT